MFTTRDVAIVAERRYRFRFASYFHLAYHSSLRPRTP